MCKNYQESSGFHKNLLHNDPTAPVYKCRIPGQNIAADDKEPLTFTGGSPTPRQGEPVSSMCLKYRSKNTVSSLPKSTRRTWHTHWSRKPIPNCWSGWYLSARCMSSPFLFLLQDLAKYGYEPTASRDFPNRMIPGGIFGCTGFSGEPLSPEVFRVQLTCGTVSPPRWRIISALITVPRCLREFSDGMAWFDVAGIASSLSFTSSK